MSGPGHFYAQIVAHLGMTVPSKEATIATGAITVKSGRVRVDTEADAASDNLDTINGMSDGDMAYLQPESGARTVVLRDGVGNLSCPGGLDISLADADDMVLAYHNGTNIVIIPLAIDASATAPLIFRGVITVAADFPTLAAVRPGWYYRIAADVTDNDATKTNTGAVFEAGSEIAWTGAAWADFGAGWMATSAEITTATSSVLALSPGQTAGAILTVLGMLFVDAVRVEIDGAGAIAKSQGYMSVDGAGATADDLDDISGLSAGEFLVLAADDPAGAPITIRHAIGAGKIATPGGQPIILAAESDRVLLLGGTTQATVVAVSTAAGLGRHNVETLAAGKTIATGDPNYQLLDPDAATRVVTLPAEATRDWYWIANAGTAAADILTVNNDAAGLEVSIPAGNAVLLVSDGTDWAVQLHALTADILASVAAGGGASRVGLQDAATIITATTVEAALLEIFRGPSSSNEEVLAAGKVIALTDPHVHRLDPDAATRVITLPAETDRTWYWIHNTGTQLADVLTINNDAAGLEQTLDAKQSCLIWSDGTNWHVVVVVDNDWSATWTHNVETLAAGKVIATGEPAFQTLDPDAATRVVTLPVEEDRRWYFIRNSGDAAADILTVNNDAAGLVATVNAGETLLVVSDGATWTVGFLGSSSAALASTVAGLGATRIGIADALAIITATTVEGALAELATGPSSTNEEVLAAGKTLVITDPHLHRLDPDAATRVVTLPAEADRLWYWLVNTGTAAADILTVNNDAAGLVATVNAGESLYIASDGTNWHVLSLGPSSALLAATVAGAGASRVGIADALAIIGGTTVETALQEIFVGPSTVNQETLAAGKTLVVTDPKVHRLDPDAATRVVTLPAEADRLWYWLVNTGTAAADILTVNNDAAGLEATVNAGESLVLFCDGTNWRVAMLAPSSALLASILAGGGASRIGLFDTAGFWAGADLETVLTALGVLIGGTNDAARDYTEENVVADDESLFASINKLDVAFAEKVGDEGCVAVASLDFVNQPNANDTLTIGADVYEFGGVGGNINVVIGGTPAATLTNLVTAINGSGTENIFGQAAGTDLRILSADGAGGTPVGADPSIVLAEAITHINSIWNVGNVNMNTLGGRAKAARRHSATEVVVTAAMIANSLSVAFPFAVVSFLVQAHDPAAGTIRFGTDVFMVGGGGDVACTFGGGAAPDIQVNDVLTVEAWGA